MKGQPEQRHTHEAHANATNEPAHKAGHGQRQQARQHKANQNSERRHRHIGSERAQHQPQTIAHHNNFKQSPANKLRNVQRHRQPGEAAPKARPDKARAGQAGSGSNVTNIPQQSRAQHRADSNGGKGLRQAEGGQQGGPRHHHQKADAKAAPQAEIIGKVQHALACLHRIERLVEFEHVHILNVQDASTGNRKDERFPPLA